MDVTITANTLARYVPVLRASDDDFRLRVVLHDFGMVFQHATTLDRSFLVSEEPELFDPRWDAFLAAYTEYLEEPELFDPRWDAFLAAYTEYLCYHAAIPTPAWVFTAERHLPRFWYPGRRFPRERAATILTTPAAIPDPRRGDQPTRSRHTSSLRPGQPGTVSSQRCRP